MTFGWCHSWTLIFLVLESDTLLLSLSPHTRPMAVYRQILPMVYKGLILLFAAINSGSILKVRVVFSLSESIARFKAQ